jgi:uncharacterized protein (DUF433 family)
MPVQRDLKPTETAHIYLDDRGRAWIDDTAYRVTMVVADAYGVNRYAPEEIAEHHYHELTLAQIHAALSYYHDHKAEIDAQMEQSRREVEAMRAEAEKDPRYQAFMEKVRRKREELGY